MDRAEMIELIRGGMLGAGGVWADLGAGTGNFTWALRDLLGAEGVIYAVDRDGKAIRAQHELLAHAGPGAAIIPTQADITRRLELPLLDGVLVANALHFIRDQPAALALIAGYLRPPSTGPSSGSGGASGHGGGRVLIVEYDLAEPLRWVPFPVPFARFELLAAGAGLQRVARVGRRVSPSSGVAMYAAIAFC